MVCGDFPKCFHPFQGRPLFGRLAKRQNPLFCGGQVSIPFREDLYSDDSTQTFGTTMITSSFHPFQGRAPFGQAPLTFGTGVRGESFHPFQGRAPFGHPPSTIFFEEIDLAFPSLSGKSSIRTTKLWDSEPFGLHQVSIPFREELHSDESQK